MSRPLAQTPFVAALGLALLAGCSTTSEPQDPHAAAEEAAIAEIEAPVEELIEEEVAGTEGADTPVGGLLVTVPAGWISEPPKNNMRKAQYRLLAADGSDDGASVVVFYFGGGGGGVEANFKRWAGQFEQPDGSPSMEAAAISETDVNGMAVHLMDVTGRYIAETRPGSGERVNESDHRMIAAIIESNHGSYFVKAVGPRGTIDHHAAAFDAYVRSVRSTH